MVGNYKRNMFYSKRIVRFTLCICTLYISILLALLLRYTPLLAILIRIYSIICGYIAGYIQLLV